MSESYVEAKAVLDNVKRFFKICVSGEDIDTGARVLQTEAYAGVMKAIQKYTDSVLFLRMDWVCKFQV